MNSPDWSHYYLNRQVTAQIATADGTVEARVEKISQPFHSFWVRTGTPLDGQGQISFQLRLGQVVLIRGSGNLAGSQPMEAEWLSEIVVEKLAEPAAGEVSERLAPFVDPQSRLAYLAASITAEAGAERMVGPWIESTSRLYLLVDLIASINSTRETGVLLRRILEAAREIMEAEASSLMLVDRQTGDLEVTVPTGPASSEISGKRIPKGKGFAGWVVENEKPLVVANAAEDPRFFGDLSSSGFKTHDLICVPLRSTDGEIVGVLQAVNRKGGTIYDERDVPIFMALANQAAIAIERDRLTKEALRRQLLEQELTLASEIQKGFWPKRTPSHPGYDFAGVSTPAAHVGGDYYDFIEMGEGRVGLVVADVSGKGVAAALLMASMRSALRAQVENKHAVEETVFLVNNTLVGDTPDSKFVTLFFAVLDCSNGELTYVNAGHNPPVLYNRRTGEKKTLEIGGPIVGFRTGLPFSAGKEKLEKGHVLTVFSDGVTEAQNRDEEFFGDARLLELIESNSGKPAMEIVGEIQRSIRAFAAGAPQSDDITLVVAKVLD